MRIFVAGAADAIGQQLLPLLVAQGRQVTAATRSPSRVPQPFLPCGIRIGSHHEPGRG